MLSETIGGEVVFDVGAIYVCSIISALTFALVVLSSEDGSVFIFDVIESPSRFLGHANPGVGIVKRAIK